MIASYYHRTRQVGGDLRRSHPTSHSKQGQTLSSDQGAQGSSQSGLENLQGWSCRDLFGQLISVLNYPPRGEKKVFLVSIQKIPHFSLFLVLLLCTSAKSMGPSFLQPLVWVLEGSYCTEVHQYQHWVR